MAKLHKQQNFSGFDLSKLEATLYDMKLARGTEEHLARFVGWESRNSEHVALFALRTVDGEQVAKLVVPDGRIEDARRLKLLFALVFAAHAPQGNEWVASPEEVEMVK